MLSKSQRIEKLEMELERMKVHFQVEIRELRHETHQEIRRMDDATSTLKAAQGNLDKAVGDVAAYLKTLAGTIASGVTAEDAAAIATDLNAQAAALEAAIAPSATA